jgi:L-seryl-tRNA(Ser) seleniumtransferase
MSLRDIPAVHRLLDEPRIAGYASLLGSRAVKSAIVAVIDPIRHGAGNGAAPIPPFDTIVASVCARLALTEREGLLELINGTGVLLHTNLGRAPLAREALDAVGVVASGYSNLEFDLETGTRGSRYERIGSVLREVSGAEDGLVVNNCAAAILLILDAFAKDREVIVARNQLIEIGGGFRLPDVLARSGATLVEVGTTNKVYRRDFEQALTPQTALLFRTHQSNFRIEGFVADVSPKDLAELGRRVGVPVVEDLGSGAIVDLAEYGLPHERTVAEAIEDGVDLVAFSGDKLLGGPQAGIIVGRASLIARLRANPLLRALRVDKGTLAALDATLRLYLDADGVKRIPFYAMLAQSIEALRERATQIQSKLGEGAKYARAVDAEAYAGGGTLPLAVVASVALAIRPPKGDPNGLAAALRRERPPIVGRVSGDELLLDLRTIRIDQGTFVIESLHRLLARREGANSAP